MDMFYRDIYVVHKINLENYYEFRNFNINDINYLIMPPF